MVARARDNEAMAAGIIRCPGCEQRNRVPAQAAGKPVCGTCRVPLPWITDADDDTFAAVAERSPVPALVDMWARWCLPCRLLNPGLRRLAGDLSGRVKLVKVDVEKAPLLRQRFAIQAVPTLLIVRDARVVARRVGGAPTADLREWVEGVLT